MTARFYEVTFVDMKGTVSEDSATVDCSAVGSGAGEGRGEDVSGNDGDKYADGTSQRHFVIKN